VGSRNTGTILTHNIHTVYLLLLVAAVTSVFSALYLAFTRAFTKVAIHVTLALSITLNLWVSQPGRRDRSDSPLSQRGLCIPRARWLYPQAYFPVETITLGTIALSSALPYFGFRSRIPFAALPLQVFVDVSKHHNGAYVVAFIGLLIQNALNIYGPVPPPNDSDLILTANGSFLPLSLREYFSQSRGKVVEP